MQPSHSPGGYRSIKRVDMGPQELLKLSKGGTIGAALVLVPDLDFSLSSVTYPM